ncbi:hypothetical protein AS200_09475 [Streptomyces sp. CdTB01]|nr:hypothetical protein AS200_09475 [Streptomyces sp. CdTB01]
MVIMIAAAAYVMRQLLHGGLAPSDTVGLLSFPLAVAGLLTSVLALRQPVEGGTAAQSRGRADRLAKQVEAGEGRVWRQLLGDDTKRINLAYTLHPASGRIAAAPAGGRLFTDSVGGIVSVPDIVAYYHATRPRRLLITGAPGAGKTVLALELILALIEKRTPDDDAPVPVRISLAEWDTTVPLPDLLAQHLADAYDWPVKMAEGLVEHGMVLPVLDGLDEMDPVLPGGLPDPHAPRARAALKALNAYQNGREPGPLILTCRTEHYTILTAGAGLLDAARVDIAPVSTDTAVAYLTARAPDHARWLPLLHHLSTHPTGTLAHTLSTPWRLGLTATVYHRQGDPTELLAYAHANNLDQHLLSHYISAATDIGPNPRHYTADQVHRWLAQFAAHLATTLPGTSGGGTDLVLHQLWSLPGRGRIRLIDAILTAVAVPLLWLPLLPGARQPTSALSVLSVLGLVVGIKNAAAPVNAPHPLRWRRLRPAMGVRQIPALLLHGFRRGFNPVRQAAQGVMQKIMMCSAIAYAVLAVLVYGVRVTSFPSWLPHAFRLDLELPGSENIAFRIADTAMFGFLYGGIMGLLVIALPVYLVAVPSGIIGAITAGIADESAFATTPRQLIRDDLTADLAVGLTAGSVTALAVGVAASGARYAAVYGWLMFVVFLLTSGRNAGRRYLAFVVYSALTQQLPWRLAAFLDWACETGLLRQAGPAYQFRHRELQNYLATLP